METNIGKRKIESKAKRVKEGRKDGREDGRATWSGARQRDQRAPWWASSISRRLPEANSKICSLPF